MAFTDAWLWGQGIVLFGMVIGAVVANQSLSTARPARG
jgi:hypothetical protein